MKKECFANGNPHRHRRTECKLHPYCVVDPLDENIKTKDRVPLPIPIPPHDKALLKSYFEGVDAGKFGETGP